MIQLVRPSRGHVTQWYGNTQPDGDPHAGQDYAYTNGVETFPEVYAAADGIVMFAGDSRNLGWPNPWYVNPDFNRADNWDSSAGNLIALRHKQFNADTGYGHLEKCFVKAGDTVRAGQLIGIAGETGNSRGKHLHFFLMFHPFNYNTRTYGCSDPNPYFVGSASIGPQGTITPLQEDDFMATLTEDEKKHLFDVLNSLANNAATKGDLARVPRAVVTEQIPYRDPITGGETGQTTSLGTLAAFSDFQHTSTRESLLAAVRGIVDAVKAAPGPDAAKAAEDAYAAFADKLAGIKLTVTAGDSK